MFPCINGGKNIVCASNENKAHWWGSPIPLNTLWSPNTNTGYYWTPLHPPPPPHTLSIYLYLGLLHSEHALPHHAFTILSISLTLRWCQCFGTSSGWAQELSGIKVCMCLSCCVWLCSHYKLKVSSESLLLFSWINIPVYSRISTGSGVKLTSYQTCHICICVCDFSVFIHFEIGQPLTKLQHRLSQRW